MRKRGGFTLVELIIVVLLGSLVLLAALQVLVTNERTYSAQTATISAQQSTRMALEVLFDELREASARGGDVLAISSDSIRLRLMRKYGIVCATSFGNPPRLIVLNVGATDFAAGDSVFVFADNNPNRDSDDAWIAAQVTAVNAVSVCPQDLSTATELTFNGQQGLFLADSVGLGAPIRSHLTYTFGMTTYDGDPYLGRREGSNDMVPIAGPLRSGNGVEFEYRDSLGTVTTVPADVRQIVTTIRAGSGVLNSLGEEVSDSISSWIYTRN